MSTLRVRRSARICVIDENSQVLLFRFEVPGRPPFWATAGGECESDESFFEAAKRELFEETGITADPGREIARTTPQFVTVEGEKVQADERYFAVSLTNPTIDVSHHTELEQRVMTQHRWFSQEELSAWPEAIYPENLSDILDEAVSQ